MTLALFTLAVGFVAVFGALIGSFLNVVVYRVPAGRSIVSPPSACGSCGTEIKRFGLDYVHLDISDKDPDFVAGHFPNIYEKLLTLGIDMTKQPIPVVPSAHFTCGGVLTDLAAHTDVDGLYAIAAGSAGSWLSRSRVRIAERIAGSCLIGGGVWLALARR